MTATNERTAEPRKVLRSGCQTALGYVWTSLIWYVLVGGVIVVALFIGAAGFVTWNLYSRVATIAFHDNAVEIRYFWLRPAVKLSASASRRCRAADEKASP